jgi:hypothetical protein
MACCIHVLDKQTVFQKPVLFSGLFNLKYAVLAPDVLRPAFTHSSLQSEKA